LSPALWAARTFSFTPPTWLNKLTMTTAT
jgi:hypothetical protein